MSELPTPLFEVVTPLGFAVRTTPEYWELLEDKHAEIRARQQDVKRCLTAPQQIRRSKQDPGVYLFYQLLPPYHLCVVVKRLNGEGFIVTCYVTDAIKEGRQIWPTSE